MCRKKLTKKGEELDAVQKECDRRNTLINALTAERDKSAVVLAAAQAKLRRLSQEAATAAPAYKVDAAKVGRWQQPARALWQAWRAACVRLYCTKRHLQDTVHVFEQQLVIKQTSITQLL